MPIDRMFEKAYGLLQKKRVEQIDQGLYNVVGDHGTYAVARRIDGTVNCSCPGFVRRRRCSHSLAVLMLNQPSLLRSIEREIGKAADRGGLESAQR